MEENNPNASQASTLCTIEELREKNQTPDRVFQGMKAAKGWKTGKSVTEEDYQNAVKGFLESPIDGKKVKTKDA